MVSPSEYLRSIEETEGRSPTVEEGNIATKMKREQAGLSDEGLDPTSLDYPYESEGGKTSDFGRTVLDTSTRPLEVVNPPYNYNAPLKTKMDLPTAVSQIHAIQRAQLDSIIKGTTEDFAKDVAAYSRGVDTTEDELIRELEKEYMNDLVDQQVLAGIYDEDMSPEEKIERIVFEYDRLGVRREEIRTLVALNLLRQGLGSMPTRVLDQVVGQLQPSQAQALWHQHNKRLQEEWKRAVDKMAAAEGVGFDNTTATLEIIKQDVAPFWGATTRILGTNKFLPQEVDMSWIRKGFPGEVRQEIREWWVQASPEDRRKWLKEIGETLSNIRKGDKSGIYTRYLMIENLMGIFTEELLYNDDSTDTLDRVMGNLDTALGMVVGVGLFLKRGKSIADLFTAKKANAARQAATAGGARAAEEALDESLAATAKELGLSSDEAAISQLNPPKQLELDLDGLDVETDTVKHTTAGNTVRRARILNYLDTADITLLDDPAKAAALKREVDALSNRDTVHLHHKMTAARGLPNGAGFEIDAVVGARGGEGWHDLTDLLDDMKEMDPYQEFTIVRRNAKGKIEELDISFAEIVDFYANGRIPRAMDEFLDQDQLPDIVRHFGMRRIDKISSDELSAALDNGWLEPGSEAWTRVRKELNDRVSKAGSSSDPLLLIDGEELFARFKVTHYFDAQDMQKIDGFRYWNIPGIQSAVRFIGRLFPPNTKFGSLYEAARKAYHMEEASLAEFADMLVPFDNLSIPKKRQVQEMLEWAEDYAKDMHHETGVAKAPTTEELIGEFSHFDDDVFEGFLAHREAMEGLYDVFNRRMYRDFSNRGFITIRGTDDSLPNYHGRPMRVGSTSTELEMAPGHYYDPIRRETVKLSAEDIKDIVDNGGGAIKLDFGIDIPGGGKTTQILARKGEYELGPLSSRVLNKYEGYQFRFYEDPYYIVKRTYGATVDGVKIADDEFIEEAVATAVSAGDAQRWLRGMATHNEEYWDTRTPRERFVVQRAVNTNNDEGKLYQKQMLNREGRLFWDSRNFERLPDTTGNRAKVADPYQAMQKGLALAMRQSTQEGLFDAMKVGFVNEFGDLPIFANRQRAFQIDELPKIEDLLVEGRNTARGDLRVKYRSALEYIRYMRNQMGTDTFAVPALRNFAINILETMENFTRGRGARVFGRLERAAMTMDPFSRARKIAYGAFMVLRPVRQALLQSAQISMLTGLDPKYIGTGRVFSDAYALRIGLSRFRKVGLDDGWSDSPLAEAMGLTKKEYKRLVEEFQRSGMLGSVNTHSFNASGRNLSARLDPNAGPAGRFMYSTRARGRAAFNFAGKIGFEWGEQNNLTFSYLTALRRVKRRHGIDDLTKMSRSQWDEVVSEADGLALAMTRPNKFAYQSGATGTLFQFLSFQHRAMLTMLGLNPKLSKKDWMSIVGMNYMLWGSNMFGAEEWARDMLAEHGLAFWGQQEVVKGVTIQDVMVAGIIETGLNGLFHAMSDKHNDLNFGIFAPGAAVAQLYEGFYDLLTSAPTDMEMLGPFENQASGFVKGAKFALANSENQFKSFGQKFMEAAEMFGKELVPQLNDLQTVWVSAQLKEWVEKDGDKLGFQPTIQGLIARGLVGLRPEAELSIYAARQVAWENEESINNWVKRWKPTLRTIVNRWETGEYTPEQAYQLASIVHGLTEDAPEGVRREIYKRMMTEPFEDGKSINQIVAEMAQKGSWNIRKLLPLIDQSSMTPEQQRMLKEFVDYVAEGYVGADEQYRQMIESELNERTGEK